MFSYTISKLNSFGIIDEKQLADLSAVIELTKWVKDGNVIPYFVWCLRDFMLDYKQYNNSDDYMENVLNIANYDQNSEKYQSRKNFTNFFKDRGCLFFVRPVNDEKKIRNLEEQEYDSLRPEFKNSIQLFKERVMGHLKPKRYNNKILNGSSFAKLITEIITSFNDAKTPEISSSVERILEGEKKELILRFKKEVDDYLDEFKGKPEAEASNVIPYFWQRVYEYGEKKHDKELCTNVFSEILEHLIKVIREKEYQSNAQVLTILDKKLESLINNSNENTAEFKAKIPGIISELGLTDTKLPVDFVYNKLVKRLLQRQEKDIHELNKTHNFDLEEKEKDLEAEKEKKRSMEKFMKEQKSLADEYNRKIENYQNLLKTKNNQLNDLRNVDNNEQTLLNQLAFYEEKINKLEQENKDLRLKGNKPLMNKSLLEESLIEQLDTLDISGEKASQLKEYFEYLKEEVLKENSYLNERVEFMGKEIEELKIQNMDIAEKDKKIKEMENMITKLRNTRNSFNDNDVKLATYIADNKRLKAERINYLYVIKEICKCLKKKKNHQVRNALSMLEEDDSQEIEATLKEFKVKY